MNRDHQIDIVIHLHFNDYPLVFSVYPRLHRFRDLHTGATVIEPRFQPGGFKSSPTVFRNISR